ncbi:MAG: hypothetical protein KJO27_04760 [Gammaproteobacteria bacterium]|nr:hypothetical protein [Gammaproteobacteria bacterium]NNL44721.1 hypothetical protein [Woeseiaceae bacterium]
MHTNLLRSITAIQSRFPVVAICLLACAVAVADQEDPVTTVSGTDGDDIIDVVTSESATAGVSSIIGETSSADGTVIDSLGGDDMVTVSGDVDASSDVNAGIFSNPERSDNTATSTAVMAGDGADIVNTSGLNTSSAISRAGYQAVLSVDLSSAEVGSDEVDVTVNAEANSTGIDAGDGEDTVISSSVLESSATTTTGGTAAGASAGLGADFSDSVTTKSASIAKSSATGINAGAGGDQVTNTGPVTTDAMATSGVLAVDVVSSDPMDADKKVQSKLDASAKAEATSTGIETDGDETEDDSDTSTRLVDGGLEVTREKTETAVSGNDTVTNTNSIDSTARAISDSTSISASSASNGSLEATINAEATATSSAISTGDGNDTIANSGAVFADSGSIAYAVGASIAAGTGGDPDAMSKPKTETATNVTATSSAIGIDADGPAQSTIFIGVTNISTSGISNSRTTQSFASTGSDTVSNTNIIEAISTALSASRITTVQIATGGAAESTAKSTAKTYSSGINLGGGNDFVDSSGAITATATSTGGALALSFSQSGDDAESKADATVTSESVAVGIAGDGIASDVDTMFSTTIDDSGLTIAWSLQETTQHGDDDVANSAIIDAAANSTSGAVGASATIDGAASAEVTSNSISRATAVDAGGGTDLVNNSGALTSTATSTAGALAVGFGQKSAEDAEAESEVKASATAEANAAGIAGDGGKDVMTTFNLDIGSDGLSTSFDHRETAQSGDDDVTNIGNIDATANSTSGAVGASATIDGAASTDINSTSTSRAAAIDAGGGSDLVDNSGELITAAATSNAGALGVSFAQKPGKKDDASVAAAATAEAVAVGIAGDSGKDETISINLDIGASGLTSALSQTVTAQSSNDVIDSSGSITVDANANSATIGVGVAIDGTAKADIKASAASNASGITGGGGDDQVSSDGVVTVISTSQSAAVAAGVGVKSADKSKAKTKVAAETTAEATATGIATDGGLEDSTLDVDLTIDGSGIQASYARTSTAASGDDTLTNLDTVTSTATATTGAASVAVTIGGAARTDLDSTAEATARGLNSGGGADTIDSTGERITTTATATAATVEAAVSTDGSSAPDFNVGLMSGGTTASSDAVGISSAGSDHSTSATITTDISFDDFSVTGSFEKIEDHVTGDAADEIINAGELITTSNATALAVDASVAVPEGAKGTGIALTLGRAKADAHVVGIESGNDDDLIDNQGKLTSNATATAAAANVSVTAKGGAVATNAVWDGGTTANATATGIDADSGTIKTTRIDAEASRERAQVVYETTEEAASGDDVIFNSGEVNSTATVLVPSVTVAVSTKGVAAAVSTSSSESEATGIRGGDGEDAIENVGDITSTADATALTANVSVELAGAAIAADAVWDGGTSAEATATGIAGDGGDRTSVTRLAIGTDEMSFSKTNVIASGADTIMNSGSVDAIANATAASASVAVAVKGVATATATSTANASATAIDAGAGNEVDNVSNTGVLTTDATALATSASVAVTTVGGSVAGDSVWDGGTGADARARGIDVGSGGETINNDGTIDTGATATTASVAASVSLTGLAAATATSTATADSIAIDASAGDDADTVINDGRLISDAQSTAAAASISFTQVGAAVTAGAVWDGGTGAESIARGIDVGDGADSITNTGAIDATTIATAAEVSGSVSLTGVAGAIATSNSDSQATAIYAGNESDLAADDVTNTGNLTADATASAVTAAVSVTTAGVAVAGGAVWDGGTTSEATARGIETGGGQDTVDNTGEVKAKSDAKAAELSAAVAVTGVAGAISTSTAESDATAIHTGDGAAADTVMNSGMLTADADSIAATAAVSFTSAGAGIAGGAVWDGGTTATSNAIGIAAGEGADEVFNEGDMLITSDAAAAEAAVAIAVGGFAGAIATSTSEAAATGIDVGAGNYDDNVFTSGDITASAAGLANTVTIAGTGAGVTMAADSIWDGGTSADVLARGVETGLGADIIENQGNVLALTLAEAASGSVSVGAAGLSVAIATATADADSIALDAGTGDYDDAVVNSGNLGAESTAIAASAAVSFRLVGGSVAGGDVWDGGTAANSTSVAMALGEGGDTVTSDGEVTADSVATSTGVSVAVTIEGVAGGISAANAHADATGIDVGAGDDSVDSAGQITASSLANANSVSAAGVKFGVSAAGNNSWDGGTRGEATASGISAGDGMDSIDNSANIDSTATAAAPSVSVSFTVGGVSGANSTSSADAKANAIDGGANDDRIDNLGNLTATADANAVAVNVAVTGVGVGTASDAVWDGGTTTDAIARAIDAGDGDDVIVSGVVADGEPEPEPSSIMANADATSVSVAAAVTVGGVAGAISTSTANGNAAGIDAGDGDDLVLNNSDVTGKVTATSDSVSVAVTGIGGAVAGDAFWDGGTTANADAFGVTGGGGADELRNTNIVTADALSDAQSVAAAATVAGVTGAVAVSTSTANAAGMSGDDGEDLLVNEGTVESYSAAMANGVSVAVSGVGGAGSLLNNSSAEATTAGLAGGEGIDTLVNMSGATIDTTASAETKQIAVAATLWGVAAADTKTTATASGSAIDGGAADDIVINDGTIMQAATADAKARSISVTGFGGNITNAESIGHSISTGLAGDTGNDQLSNTGDVTLNSTASAIGHSFGFTSGGGVVVADATADATAEASGLRGDGGADMLSNSGNLSVATSANTSAGAVGANLGVGYTLAKANSVATTNVAGMLGGDDNDMLNNAESGVIDLLATANVNAESVSITVGGVADAEARTIANVLATGLGGGAGDDSITNQGDLAVNGTSQSTANGGAISVAGLSSSKAGTEVDANVVGMSGGEGVDTIVNTGRVFVGPLANIMAEKWMAEDDAWMSVLSTTSNSFGFVGKVDSESAAYARTTSTGFSGGDAGDVLSNDGELTVYATAQSIASSGTLGIFGSSDATGGSGAFTNATGLSGDAGDDVIESLGFLDVVAKSSLTQNAATFQFGGAGDAGSALEAATDAVGISGGAGQDGIRMDGVIKVSGRSDLDSSSSADAAFGSTDATAQLRGVTRAIGADGGDDNDIIENLATGSIEVSATTRVIAESMAYTFAGGTGSESVLDGISVAAGLTGGGGNDMLTNDGFLKATADAALTSTGGSKATFTGGSGSDTTGTAKASSRAIGLEGGDGDDVLTTRGTTVVEAITVSDSRNRASSSASFTSNGSSGSVSEATANAVGLDGGAGVDWLVNEGDVIVTADSTAYGFSYSSGAKVSLSGDAKAFANSVARAIANGISATNGDAVVINDTEEGESINVTATAGTVKDLTTTLSVYRLQGNIDEDITPDDMGWVPPIAETVTTLPDLTDPENQMKYDPRDDQLDIVYCLGDDSNGCVMEASVNSAGNHYVSTVETIDSDPDPDNEVLVDVYSWELVGAVENEPDWTDPAIQAEYTDGQIVACKAESCWDDPTVAASATYWQVEVDTGVDPNDPADDVYDWNRIDGLVIEVNTEVTETSFPTYAFANGNGLDGDGFATVSGRSEAIAKGIALGDGNNNVTSGNMSVEAIANTVVNVGSDGDVFGDSKAFVTSGSAVAKAVGIELGDGSNLVLNTGDLSVIAEPSAQGFSGVSAGGGVCIWFFGWWCGGAGDGVAAVSVSFVADAKGIISGNGADSITNDGTIVVEARPDVAVDARRGDDEYAARASGDNTGGASLNITADSTAIGIQTSGGNDSVTNNGSIEVSAYDLQSGCASSPPDVCGLEPPEYNPGTLQAVGIDTGDGDDTVTNNGLVSAMTFENNDPSTGIGIDLGAGNDALTLGDGSQVLGSISLGSGDDSLTLSGVPMAAETGVSVFSLNAGAGLDSLSFVGDGSFSGSLDNFETATKLGDGTYTLVQPLATVESLTIDGGILSLSNDYTFSSTGTFSTYIHSNGDNGQLLVNGTVFAYGAISVEKRGDTYIANDTRYTLVEATPIDPLMDGVMDGFTVITLPEARPLLSFELQQSEDSLDVVAVAASFSTVTENRSYNAVADNLFGLTAVASDDFARQLGTLQGMDSGFDRAFASLSPDSYEGLTSNTLALGHQTTQLLRTHLGNARAVRQGSISASAAYEPVVLAYEGGQLNTNGAAIAPFYMGQAGPLRADDPALSTTAGATGNGSNRHMAQTWASAFFGSGDYDVTDGLTEYDHDSAGFTIGADYFFRDNLIAGFMISYAETDIDQLQAAATSDIYAWSGGLYATGYWDSTYVEGGITFTNQSFKNWRSLEIGTAARTAMSEHDGDTWMAFVGAGREYDFGTWHMEPYGTLYYFDIDEDAFEETGADSLNLLFAKKSTSALLGEIGTTFVRLQDVDSGVIDWHASLAYNHDFDIDDGSIAYAYGGQPGSILTIDDRNITSGSAVFGAGLAYIRKRSTLAFDYRGQFNSDYRNDIVGLRLAYSF